MSASQWLDLMVLTVAFIAAVSGWRSGALGSLLSFLGVALGAMAGVLLAPYLVNRVDGDLLKAFSWLTLVLALVIIGEVAGVVLGRAVRESIRNPAVRGADSVIGVVLQLAVVLIAAWLLATPLTVSSQPRLAAAINDSRVLREVNDVAPGWLKNVPRRLSAVLNNSGLPAVLEPFTPTHRHRAAVDAPDIMLAQTPIVETVLPSVLRIRSEAPKCQKMLEGTGFVIAPGKVMTNAHVVAGSERVTVDSGEQSYQATVVAFDSDEDISILSVPDLAAAPLEFAAHPAYPGDDALVLGYPGGGVFEAVPARIGDTINLEGPDIYQRTTVLREVYTVRGTVRQGNSGGPMIDMNGQVLGVVFGAGIDDADTGYVLTAGEVSSQLAKMNNTEAVPTQSCVG